MTERSPHSEHPSYVESDTSTYTLQEALRSMCIDLADTPFVSALQQAADRIDNLEEQYEALNSRYMIEIKNYEEAEQRAERLEEQLEALHWWLDVMPSSVYSEESALWKAWALNGQRIRDSFPTKEPS